MKIKRLVIENFKSIERIELIEPNPFTVFVGPNGSGKSNIFEALEFMDLQGRIGETTSSIFGGWDSISRRQNISAATKVDYDLEKFTNKYDSSSREVRSNFKLEENSGLAKDDTTGEINYADQEFQQLLNFYRIFVANEKLRKLPLNDDQRLALDASNLEKVLKRVLSNSTLKSEIFEWLELFIPEFKSVDIITNQFDGKDILLWYEQFSNKPFTKDLISDGTYNILALLTAVYQSDDKPQFLCIEEPENGLHPQVARELVDFFRIMCQERGHYIWLNTHSQSMVSRVRAEELVVVEKKEGATQIRQFKGKDFYGMRADEAWLTNSLGGGLAW